jgi:peptidoglycan pentaglycine glycine transferase (the first glycine)
MAAASVLDRHARRPLPGSILYVPRGPALDWDDEPLVDRVLGELEAWRAATGRCSSRSTPMSTIPTPLPPFRRGLPAAPAVAALLSRRGWRFSESQVQFRNSVLLDLRPDEDTLLAGMKQKCRYNLRLAQRRGVEVRQGTAATWIFFTTSMPKRRGGTAFPSGRPPTTSDAWGSFLARARAGCSWPRSRERPWPGSCS